jgi:hypothetical protein
MSTRIGSGRSFSSVLASRFYWNGSTGNVLRPKLLKNRHVRCCLLVFPREEQAGVTPTEGSAQELVFAVKNVWRAAIEVGFIIFLFYSNLLMGEFERSGIGQKKGVAGAIADVFTAANFGIAMVAALIGYSLFEFFRKKF